MGSILLTIAALCISILLTVVFHSKKGTNNHETKLYSAITKINLAYCITNIVAFIVTIATGNTTIIGIIQKVQMIEIISIILLLYTYEVYILDFSNKTKKTISIVSGIIALIVAIAIALTPILIGIKDYNIITKGLSYKIMFYTSLAYLALILIYIARIYIKTKKDQNKALPFAFLVIIYSIALLANKYINGSVC